MKEAARAAYQTCLVGWGNDDAHNPPEQPGCVLEYSQRASSRSVHENLER